MSSRLVFTPGRHTYSLDGQRVPGVTTVIRKATDKPALVGAAAKATAEWAAEHADALGEVPAEQWARTAAGAYRAAWNESARVGTLLHDAARQLVAGDPLTPVDAEGVQWPDDVIRSAEQLARFMDEWDVSPVLAERPVFHAEHLWAGTLDLVADLHGGKRWLLDYKTGRTGIYPEHAMQQAAYRHATHVQVETDNGLEDWPMPKVDRVGCVWVRPEGYELVPVRADAAMYQTFLHMLPVARFMDWTREQSVGDPLPLGAVS